MKAYVINMGSAVERMAFQHKQLKALGLNYERAAAVTISDVSEGQYTRCASDWERPMSRAEVACFFSHFKLWECVAESSEPALILEDDVVMASNVAIVLNELEAMGGLRYVSLETRKRKKMLSQSGVSIAEDYKVHEMLQDRCGAAAYVLWPEGAKLLIAEYARLGAAITDAFISRSYKLNARQVVPAPVIQADCCAHYGMRSPITLKSSIENTRYGVGVKGYKKLQFKLKRIMGQLRMGVRQLLNIRSAQRVEVKPAKILQDQHGA